MPTFPININVSPLGVSVLGQANPAAQSWIRVETTGAITLRTAAETLSDLGAQASGTYVTAVTGSGNIASSGGTTPNLTFTGVLPTANGGTGVNIASAILVTGAGITNESGASVSRIRMSADNNVAKILSWATAGSARWALRVEGNETGANAGADIAFRRYDDAGTYIDTVWSAVRSTGAFTFQKPFYGTSSLTLGAASTTVGSIVLQNATNANTITIQSGVTSSSHTLTLPVANASGVLTNDGAGALTWAAASSGITIDSTAITGGGANRILFENSSNQVSESAKDFYFESASPYAHVFAAGRSQTITGASNSFFGYQAGTSINSGQGNTGVGRLAACGTGSDSYNTCIGYYTMNGNSGSYNVALGYEAMYAGSNSNSIAIGYRAQGGHSSTILIGRFTAYSNTTATHQGILGSNDTNGYISDWYFNGVTHTAPYSVVLHACHGSGTNVAGANITIDAGNASGNAASGNKKTTTSVKGASGTTVQTSTDRQAVIGKYVDITESAATTFGTLALTTSGTTSGGEVMYTIEANDGTDYQSLTGVLKYDVVNKAGTLTVTYSDVQNGAGACSAGTLTATVTAAVSGTSVQFQANAVSSLAQTVLRVSFQVINNFGVATIAPA